MWREEIFFVCLHHCHTNLESLSNHADYHLAICSLQLYRKQWDAKTQRKPKASFGKNCIQLRNITSTWKKNNSNVVFLDVWSNLFRNAPKVILQSGYKTIPCHITIRQGIKISSINYITLGVCTPLRQISEQSWDTI